MTSGNAYSVSLSVLPQRNRKAGTRGLKIRLSARDSQFRVVDLLSEYGRFETFETFIEEGLKTLIENYLKDAEQKMISFLQSENKNAEPV